MQADYRTVRLPSNVDVPVFVKDDFADFYRDMFAREVEKERMRTVFLEYAWDMGWCDPCAADPLSDRELSELGVFWIGDRPSGDRRLKPQARDVFITRLHLRYTGATFPEDLVFQETGDRTNFQGRYVIRHPWQGSPDACRAARDYFADLATFSSVANAEALQNGVFLTHMGLALLLLMYIPFSKILHFGGIFFTHQMIRKQ